MADETKETALVVDDNPALRRIISEAFKSAGFSVCEAGNGQEAINVAEKSSPDLIILDLVMPVMNGLQAAPELRRVAPKTIIILFTLYGSDMESFDASNTGIDLVLSKTDALPLVVEKACILMHNSAPKFAEKK
jgi:two-component system phosphate regulon response regulator PhoB